jgi:hypothetical protein
MQNKKKKDELRNLISVFKKFVTEIDIPECRKFLTILRKS